MLHHRCETSERIIPRSASWSRSGFTLVELLTVLVILSMLGSLAVGGILRLRHRGTIASTRATLRKLNEVVMPHYEEYEYERISLPVSTYGSLSPQQIEGLRRLLIRRKMTLEMPERAGDLEWAFAYPPPVNPNMVNTLRPLVLQDSTFAVPAAPVVPVPPAARRYRDLIELAHGPTGAPNLAEHVWLREQQVSSAELLHMIVTRGPAADAEIISHFRDDEVTDIDGDGLLEFADGWGRPIEFLRWPVGYKSVFQSLNGVVSSVDRTISPNGHRMIPLIYSTGGDGIADMVTRSSPPSAADLFSYHDCGYDPFHIILRPGASPDSAIAPESKMVIPPTGSLALASTYVQAFCRTVPDNGFQQPVTFVGGRVQRAVDPSVVPPDPGWVAVGRPFFVVGSEFDTNNDGRVNAADNVSNHDLTR